MKASPLVVFLAILVPLLFIGVVIGTVYGAVSKSQPPRTPSASFSSAEKDSASTMKLIFGDADSSIQYLRLKIILHFNDSVRDVYLGTYPFDPNGTGYVNTVAGGQNYSVLYDDSDSDGLVDSGEHLGVMYSGSELPAGNYTVGLIWMGSGNAITIAHILV